MNAVEIGRNRSLWLPVPRGVALTESRSRTVAVMHRAFGRDTASLFQPSNRFYRSNGPYLYDGLRYFLYMGAGGSALQGGGKSLGLTNKPPEAELEPMEAFDQGTGEMLSLGSPVRKKPEPHPIEFQLVDGAGKALADAEYEVVLPDGSVRRGKTGTDGLVKIPDNMHKGEAKLTLKSKAGQQSANASSGLAATSVATAAPKPEFTVDAVLELQDKIPELPAVPELPVVPALPVIPLPVEILLTDAEGLPMPKTAFKAQFPDGTVASGESDPAGLIRFPDNTQAGEIVLTLPGLAKAA